MKWKINVFCPLPTWTFIAQLGHYATREYAVRTWHWLLQETRVLYLKWQCYASDVKRYFRSPFNDDHRVKNFFFVVHNELKTFSLEFFPFLRISFENKSNFNKIKIFQMRTLPTLENALSFLFYFTNKSTTITRKAYKF